VSDRGQAHRTDSNPEIDLMRSFESSTHSFRRAAGAAAVTAIAAAAMLTTAPAQAQMARAAAPITAASSAKPALDDPTIVAIFDAANSWDIEAGRVALKKSHSKDVRSFARMMIHDHTAVRKMGRDLAKKLKVTPTPPGKDFALYQSHLAAMKTLRATKRGAAFDKAYIDNEVAFHQAVIDAVTTTLLPATQNAELKNLETTVAPNFQAHLLAAKKLQGELVAAK
jgi:putative membrane protein